GGAVDCIVDGGDGGLIPSTIVDCTADEIQIVRYGKGDLEE
ncbi:MAG: threonylcarbamoyl-AMP synthase, partial [Muribaculaceae bacterium]|nr:threonylcarbamoyl-AMP synthase [Muribaculaceae bacterium]